MARRTGGPGITLFSFQDIITSVSGIMIFITLMLALELMDKSQKGGAAVAASRDASELKARIDAVRSERDRLKTRAISSTRLASRSTLAEARALKETEALVEQAERDLEALELRSSNAKNREEEAKTRKAGVEIATQAEYERKSATIEALRKTLDKARTSNRVYFDLEADSPIGRDGWLALLDGRGVTVAPLSRSLRPLSFLGAPRATRELDSASSAFVDWANKEARGSYILLVARPSGSDRIWPIQESFTSDSRQYGLELVTESQEVLDSENGVHRR